MNATGAGNSSFTLPVVERQWTDFSQGTLVPTGSQSDVGLSGRGFLAVNGSSGPLYTRNGSLQVTSEGKLVTAEGYAVRGVDGNPIQVSPGKAIEITPDGSVRQGGLPVGQIAVVDFKNTSLLKKMGGTYFINSDPNKNPPAAATPPHDNIRGSEYFE